MTAPDPEASAAAWRLLYRFTILERGLPPAADRNCKSLFSIIHNLSSTVIDEGLHLEKLKDRYEEMCPSDFDSCTIQLDLLALRHLLVPKVPIPSLS